MQAMITRYVKRNTYRAISVGAHTDNPIGYIGKLSGYYGWLLITDRLQNFDIGPNQSYTAYISIIIRVVRLLTSQLTSVITCRVKKKHIKNISYYLVIASNISGLIKAGYVLFGLPVRVRYLKY